MCTECEDTAAGVSCQQCEEIFCDLCFKWLHGKGNRRQHVATLLPQTEASGVGVSSPGRAVNVDNTTAPKITEANNQKKDIPVLSEEQEQALLAPTKVHDEPEGKEKAPESEFLKVQLLSLIMYQQKQKRAR